MEKKIDHINISQFIQALQVLAKNKPEELINILADQQSEHQTIDRLHKTLDALKKEQQEQIDGLTKSIHERFDDVYKALA